MEKRARDQRQRTSCIYLPFAVPAEGSATAKEDNPVADFVWKYFSEEIAEVLSAAQKDLGLCARD